MLLRYQPVHAFLAGGRAPEGGEVRVYPRSLHTHGDTRVLMIRDGGEKKLAAAGSGPLYDDLAGEVKDGLKLCGLTRENRLVLNQYFPFTAPRAFGKRTATIGLGDRLGRAGPGQIRAVRGRDVKPVLAQQSVRELTLTGRTFADILDAAAFAVFQEGYTEGYGADGDHLKKEEDIRAAFSLGFTMLTLDCSDMIDNEAAVADEAEVRRRYEALSESVRRRYESAYLDRTFRVGEYELRFGESRLMRDVLVYHRAIEFMVYIYEHYIRNAGRKIDFEISIDETMTPTTPESHFLVASELAAAGADLFSMAPRFIGEFQKGIDYIGDRDEFERQLAVHAAIADHFGYKLSIHSGSDKFSVFPAIGRHTRGRFHVKTAGTNWLEAVRIIARVNPALYRKMHRYALERFEDAKAYYHISADPAKIAPLDAVPDDRLPGYLEDDNARQVLHIAYWLILQGKDDKGAYLLRDDFFRTLDAHEEEYARALEAHIGRHLDLLGVPKAGGGTGG
ncbi:MAG: hypothetical protein BAA02_12120 [Paenibacillaceae bacterium ZCTH02-B3]|nr:MAG: hypothetical protein BAA02_12120 [Paenibacillaceae bacterium ZCTH02-B3]